MTDRTIAGWLRWAAEELKMQGIPGARREAELLLSFAGGLRREELILREREIPDPAVVARFENAVFRRALREPLAYITGTKEFYGLPMRVRPGVLIPRPETELLVEECLKRLAGLTEPDLLLADVCTGSGAIAVALAIHCPKARVLACDISPDAVEVCRENSRLSGAENRVEVFRGDLFEPLHPYAGRIDALLINPPYIPAGEVPGLQPEVSRHEPALALSGGEDGLDFYRRIAKEAGPVLRPGGVMILEIGWDQEAQVLGLLRQNGWKGECLRDLAGLPRVVAAER